MQTRTRQGVPVTVQAYILIQTEVGKAAAVAAEIAGLKGVTMAEDVTGPYDVIVRAEARNVDELGTLVAAKVRGVPGIPRPLPCPVVHLCPAGHCASPPFSRPSPSRAAPRARFVSRSRMHPEPPGPSAHGSSTGCRHRSTDIARGSWSRRARSHMRGVTRRSCCAAG